MGFVHIRSFAHDLMMRSRGFIQEEYSALEQQLDEERGKLSPATKIEGCLKKKNRKHGILGSKWNKRWFVLENGILTYAKNKQEIVKGEIQVFSLHELEYVNQRKERLEFELKFPERMLHLQDLSKDDLRKWINAFESAKSRAPVRAHQNSPTSPLDVDCSDLPGYRARQSANLRDCKSAGATSGAKKKDVSPRSLLANPASGRRCFGNYFDDFETDMQSSGYVTNLEADRLDRNQDTKIEEFCVGRSESPLTGVLAPQAMESDRAEVDLGFEKPFASLNLDEKSDEGWLDDDWDADDDESTGSGRQEGEKTTSPIVFIASPKSGSLCTSKSGTISSRDGLLECDMKAVKYDSQITLPEMEPLTPEASETMEFCEGKAVHGVLDDITADDNWLDEDWDSE